ncbi:MAG: hypothetical protein HOY78_02235 [Saccharothrix sp.]|nr:hypothetical protein [Saccharothrix sp.]
MTTRRTVIPQVKPGDWVQVTKVMRVDERGFVALSDGGKVLMQPAALARNGFSVETFDHEPGPTELKTARAVLDRAVDAELMRAQAQTLLEAERGRASEDAERARRALRDMTGTVAATSLLLKVETARSRLLRALLEYAERVGPQTVPVSSLYAKAIAEPCPAYVGDVRPPDADPFEEREPWGEGAPCVRVNRHIGDHASVDGARFVAPTLFDYKI